MSKIYWLVYKDVRLFFQGGTGFTRVFLYGLVFLALIHTGYGPGTQAKTHELAIWLWIIFWFTSYLVIDQFVTWDVEEEIYLFLYPAVGSGYLLYWGKFLACFLSIASVHTFLALLFHIFFGTIESFPWIAFIQVWFSVILGVTLAGMVLSFALGQTFRRSLIFPVLFFPVMMGYFSFGVQATQSIWSTTALPVTAVYLRWIWIGNILNFMLTLWVSSSLLYTQRVPSSKKHFEKDSFNNEEQK